MTAPLSVGCVHIAATMAEGAVVAASIACDRPYNIGAVLVRHPLDQIPDLVGRLHTLCAVSQSLAARSALTAAGVSLGPFDSALAERRLAAERLVELLRATAIGFADVVTPDPNEIQALRHVLAAGSGTLANGTADGAGIEEALAVLGLTEDLPLPESWAGRVTSCAAEILWSDEGVIDPLGPDDDEAVVAALLDAGEAFAARPVLPGRRVHTGPVARAARAGRPCRRPLSARFAEIAQAARRVAGMVEETAIPWLRAGQIAPGIGFAAIEGPRGRLHHLAVLDRGGRLDRYLILAPTAWTFAPDGPFAAALTRLRPGGAVSVERSVARLAALFDPCVACKIVVTHA
ncbi:hypothetical protein [Magnetospirillum molischianum]|uniref:Uncharacterized protein n=1 Tax=Magnetospirillum molischianum DSM 120 TaxID=1150626 RepID=H8FMT4_MAGML|nr:hypothetical protein [Magnetospirillum molischianum]CCG39672.1 conserved hypothetical protein [Magnetospirillum molischianum DSM 120]